jgi:DNA end-binding protein Ku
MAAIWKGTISFGLVNIPVKVTIAARAESISFNLLHSECGSRINTKTWCPKCNKEITRKDTHRGHEVAKDQYVTVSDEELKDCQPDSSHSMEIEQCVAANAVDPLLFESSYYLEPDTAGMKGYKLLHDALRAEKRYAIARATLHSREHVIVIRPYNGTLVFHTMFYQGEVHAAPHLGLEAIPIEAKELALAKQLLRATSDKFDHAQYVDGYQQSVEKLLQAKRQGNKVHTLAKRPPQSETNDLMVALQASLKGKPAKRKSA